MTSFRNRLRFGLSLLLAVFLTCSVHADSKDHYTLDNKWEKARERLQYLEAMSNPGTFERLEKLEIQKGWRCLDAGAGYGGVTRWLADKVGLEGHIDALDMDAHFLQEIDNPNVQVLVRNLVDDSLPAEAYDLVFARDVIFHIPEREAVIKKLAGALKPGGILVVEDLAMFPGRFKNFSENPEVSHTADRLYYILNERELMSFTSAYENPKIFEQIGLEEVRSSAYSTYHHGGDEEGKVLNFSMIQLKPLLVGKLGIDEDLYEKSRQQYLEKTARWWGMSRVVTVGTKPL
ncbi:class I SAM-dependent methyltransferase [Sansalvadorimonas sp. 2012CJ34-2]|uniref:Class I SAM-dependent methyltransferase n=1 Tax=Parendozoicomonas callyspongiae TaxID=2942213 RepID=A0ABT0PIN2_9GAMM|nr:class I SAM-dependent methyltransferase [Sansalvadorimonas sp. 2012CJ34-2]MCL6271242.1 class I SAM-dependent methyltransferase [Sansalvadorimonas sp. 2012CJ34-2]